MMQGPQLPLSTLLDTQSVPWLCYLPIVLKQPSIFSPRTVFPKSQVGLKGIFPYSLF